MTDAILSLGMVSYPAIFADAFAEQQISSEGFIVLPLLTPDQVLRLTELYRLAIPDLPEGFSSTAFLDDGIVRRHLDGGIREILAPLLAPLMPGYEVRACGYIVKRGGPDQPPLSLHQDYTFVDQNHFRAVHLWIPLIDVSEANGCLTAVPGSHEAVNHISAMCNNPSPFDGARQFLEEECAKPLPMKAGEGAFFNMRLLHGSTSNTDEGLRIAVAVGLLPRDATQLLYVVDEEDPGKFHLLEIADGYNIRFGRGVKILPPYPEGVTKVAELRYKPQPLPATALQALRDRRFEPPARPAEGVRVSTGGPSFLKRMFGRG